jgi:muramoyltetrapeptide carboxypeptidase
MDTIPKNIIPKKLKSKSHIRVICPSRSMAIISEETQEIALDRFKELDLLVSFGKNVNNCDEFLSSTIEDRITDLHDAFEDQSVDAILTAIGGYNCNQLLDYIDYDLIKRNPKILCGYSDITTLTSAIYTKTGLIGYSGPHFSSFGMLKDFNYIQEYFVKCLFSNLDYELKPSKHWSDDLWFINQDKRTFIKNNGFNIINYIEGDFEGKIVGTHLRCLNSLQGTQYWPDLKNSILFFEEDEEITPQLFDRQLQSIIHQRGFSSVKAILLGRFQLNSKMEHSTLANIIVSKKELKDIPVISNCDFGHTTPFITFPIGGRASVHIESGEVKIIVKAH